MSELEALRLALYLFHLPSGVRSARDGPLPAGMSCLLEIAAGEAKAAEDAAKLLERPVEVVRQACGFFVEQIMLAPDADAYRVLGSTRQASEVELRRNMALVLRWAHPDLNGNGKGEPSVYASRVTRAWEALKSQERRAAYDAAHPLPPAGSSQGRTPRRRREKSAGFRYLADGAQRGMHRPSLFGFALRLLLGPRG